VAISLLLPTSSLQHRIKKLLLEFFRIQKIAATIIAPSIFSLKKICIYHNFYKTQAHNFQLFKQNAIRKKSIGMDDPIVKPTDATCLTTADPGVASHAHSRPIQTSKIIYAAILNLKHNNNKMPMCVDK
jgi:hypothetical protein